MTTDIHPPRPAGELATDFGRQLKLALTGNPNARFVYLNNFEVEQLWSADAPRLPGAAVNFSGATVNRMEEFALLLADREDVVLLKEAADPGYVAYLASLGFQLPDTLTVDVNRPEIPVTQDALASPRLLQRLRALADGRTYLMPLGVSVWEERLSEATGLPLAAPSAEICRAVNGKIYGRELVARLGLREVPGAVCRTVDELRAALEERRSLLAAGGRVVVKESLGVSGRGMVVLSLERRADQLLRLVERRAERSGEDRVDLVVEDWVEKVCDLNYQAVIARDGSVRYAGLKRAVVERGVHKGHAFPVQLPNDGEEQIRHAAEVIGASLHADGYAGVIGVDAILAADGTVYPCLEINARFNMSTYQARIAQNLLAPGHCALAATLNTQLVRRVGFAQVREALDRKSVV